MARARLRTTRPIEKPAPRYTDTVHLELTPEEATALLALLQFTTMRGGLELSMHTALCHAQDNYDGSSVEDIFDYYIRNFTRTPKES